MINRKIHRLSQLFVVLFAVAAALLFYWQVVDATYLVNRPENQRLYVAQLAIHPRPVPCPSVGGGGDAEPRRHRQPGGGHEAEAEPLPADEVAVRGSDAGEREDVGHGDRVWAGEWFGVA